MVFTEITDDIERIGPDKGTAYSFNAEENVIAGQAVKLDADNGVEPSDTDGEACIGVATQTVSAGDQVMVAGPGSRVLFTGGAAGISAGDFLASHGGTGEEGEVNTGDATGDYIVGVAHEGAGDGETFVGTVLAGGQVN